MAKACADAIAVDRQRARDQEEEEKDEGIVRGRRRVCFPDFVR
jgi:hypothetical protein